MRRLRRACVSSAIGRASTSSSAGLSSSLSASSASEPSPTKTVSIDRIAQAAGISKGLLYHYFPTKRAFFAACVGEAAQRLLEVTDLRDDIDPLSRLTQSLDAYLGFVRAHAPAFATLMHGLGIDREVTRIVNGTRNTLLGRLTEGFTRFGQRMHLVVLPATPRVHIALRDGLAWQRR